MPLVNMSDMLKHAYENQYAVGAFDLVSLDFLEAVIDAAESSRSAVILSIAEPHFDYYDYELLLSAMETAAKKASVPVAIQLDHGQSFDTVVKAIQKGCNGVMLDVSDQGFLENVENTRKVTEMAHQCGVAVVGELGYIAGQQGDEAEIHPGEPAYTLPAEAKAYVERTGVDFLAVSIGTVQGKSNGKVKLDIARLKQLRQSVDVPMVIHGGSGLSSDQYHKLIINGVVKIDYFSALSDIAAKSMQQAFKSNPQGSFNQLKKQVKHSVSDEVKRCLRLWGSAGRAAEVLQCCSAWENAEHLIIFNAQSEEDKLMDETLTRAKTLLKELPFVRKVTIAKSLKTNDECQHYLTIVIVQPVALDNIRDNAELNELLKLYQSKTNVSVIEFDSQVVNS